VTAPVSDLTGAEYEEVTAVDSPGLRVQDVFPGTTSPLISVSGDWAQFKTYVSAYSADYSKWYGAYLEVNWTCNFQYYLLDGIWAHSNSQTTEQVVYLTSPSSLVDLGATSTAPALRDAVVREYV
jgi:hypothetical protein